MKGKQNSGFFEETAWHAPPPGQPGSHLAEVFSEKRVF